jgi:hypothetical protein
MLLIKFGSAVLLALVIAGCAHQPKKPDILLSEVKPAPICQGEAQCAAMWTRAIEAVPMVSRMKVMSASDSFIQTYPTNDVGFLNGQVIKQGMGDGRYTIKGTFDCNPSTWCLGFRNRTQNTFNAMVQGFEPVK